MRLFIAINFDDSVKNQLVSLQRDIKYVSQKARFATRDNLHLTLIFLGDISPSRVKLAQISLKDIKAKKFSLNINRVGSFSRPTGDLYWAGMQTNTTLNDIYKQLYSNLRSYEFHIQNAEYTPHITLARDVLLKEGVDAQFLKDKDIDISVPVNSIYLIKSDLSSGRPEYSILYTKELD